MLFSQVLFGGSHQGSAFNLMSGKADVAAFCDTEIDPYAGCKEGEPNTTGSVYAIKGGRQRPIRHGHRRGICDHPVHPGAQRALCL